MPNVNQGLLPGFQPLHLFRCATQFPNQLDQTIKYAILAESEARQVVETLKTLNAVDIKLADRLVFDICAVYATFIKTIASTLGSIQ